MIPDLQSSIICDDVRQERNGKFILIGLFDGLAVQNLPTRFPKLCIVNRWCCGEGSFVQKTRVISPDGRTIAEGRDVGIKLASQEQTATSVEVFINTAFETEGTYWVEVLLDGQLKIRYPVSLRKIVPQQPPQQA